MLRLKIRILITITYTVRALNPFPRTSPAIISAKCFPKRGKRIHSEGIFKSTGQGLTQHGLRDSEYTLFTSFVIYQILSVWYK